MVCDGRATSWQFMQASGFKQGIQPTLHAVRRGQLDGFVGFDVRRDENCVPAWSELFMTF